MRPILFIILVNDLNFELLSSERPSTRMVTLITAYADNTNLLTEGTELS